MTISHHPDVATLMSCAAGSQPESLAAVVASHISMCPQCAAEVQKLEQIGVALFDAIATAPVVREAPVVAARALEADEDGSGGRPAEPGDVPAPLVSLVGRSLDEIAWKWLGPGVWHYPIPLSRRAAGDLRLYKLAPGQAVPEHGHGGEELTLLLRGSYRDEMGEFRTGDVADLDDEVEHRPIADATAGCICLVAREKRARFKGLLARFVQLVTGI
ncbi:MAG TPA: ChrR family anti-sigma-E factor [Hyphomicrobiaceae bacterium]|nr:ChrR family anti-sigma-E factor [Hyphomicrobiaceae bacterium]